MYIAETAKTWMYAVFFADRVSSVIPCQFDRRRKVFSLLWFQGNVQVPLGIVQFFLHHR